MAHYLRRPVISRAGLRMFRPLEQRPFSIVSSQRAMSRGEMGPQPRQQSERSVRVASQEMGKMANDIGLLPKTLIFPQRRNRPSLFRSPRAITKLYYTWLKRRLQGYIAILAYKYMSTKPRLKLLPRQIGPTAVGLHRQMYTAFAEGDVRQLDALCCDGLRASFRARIVSRPRGERWQWELVRYTKRPKVVSHRAASLGRDGMGLRQAVVRIASRQRLTRWAADGSLVKGSGQERETVEYLVVQRFMEKAVEGDWAVWGTTEETTLEDLEADEKEGMPA